MATDYSDQFETIRCEFDHETGVGRIVLDRPDSLNAMSTQTLDELPTAIETFDGLDREEDHISVRCVVISGAGDDAFCVGVDVDDIGGERYPFTASSFREALFSVESFGAPVIAEIDGYCVGGGLELALMCDFRIASEESELGFPEVDLGIFPSGVGTTQRLPLLVGPSRAKELCMTGEFLSGSEAAADGLINEAHPAEELPAAVDEFAEELAGKPPLALRAIKDTINQSRNVGLRDGIEYEYRAYLPLLHTDDYAEGAAAFSADREPEWQGK
ncbi:enoyl-CoA hydratase/isomerase family protein [Halobellus marinus]|uniref:enoyl-CoA hydratase/isomerase family protein n=1 Tax=Halobellus TaxID=1073986 RepID=UPI0028A90477|nr:enoyl-CoA hydratase/isomerase family protein [Halobellus sp. DFY28]